MVRMYILGIVTLPLILIGCTSTNTSLREELNQNPTKAIEWAMKKLQDNPNQVSLMMGIMSSHYKLDNYEQCIEWSDRAIKQIANHVPANKAKISCLEALNENEQATQLKTEVMKYIRQRQNEYLAENRMRKGKGLGPRHWWRHASPFVTMPAYPTHVHRNNISGCASVQYRINENGRVTDLQISNEYPKGFLTSTLTEYYSQLRLKPSKDNLQRVSIKQSNRWRFNPSTSVNIDKFYKYCK